MNDRLKKIDYDALALRFHEMRKNDNGFSAFYRSTDFSLWVCDLIKDGKLIALEY